MRGAKKIYTRIHNIYTNRFIRTVYTPEYTTYTQTVSYKKIERVDVPIIYMYSLRPELLDHAPDRTPAVRSSPERGTRRQCGPLLCPFPRRLPPAGRFPFPLPLGADEPPIHGELVVFSSTISLAD